MKLNSVPRATLGRLPLYLSYLKSLSETSATVSATSIARGLSLGDVQVRKDLAIVSGAGKPRVGYITAKLINDIERHLGYKNITEAILVGAGKLGRALLDYNGFEEFGISIIAGFDCNERTVRIGNGTTAILPIKELDRICSENDIKLGIITVGQGSAQEVCDKMVECGIKAIWNFAPCQLIVPKEIVLKQENLALSLAYLKNSIS
ncbi:MAG: redox-sensing transcriptional repressor Rex [Clostridia bacterium]|nr:redox-sensing transcriptional repressor Rex [Clostridia bacterium]